MQALSFFLSWWGLFLLGAIDATVAFVAPFGVDAVLVFMVAREDGLFWLLPIVATAGSTTGAGLTYWLGRKLGRPGLKHFMSDQTFERVQDRLSKRGAIAIGIAALMPPPFPLKPFVLASGAFGLEPVRFFAAFTSVRALRFGLETFLARRYGDLVLGWLESDVAKAIVAALVGAALAATVVSAALLWRKMRKAGG